MAVGKKIFSIFLRAAGLSDSLSLELRRSWAVPSQNAG